jgi:hypothetical protein
MEQPTENTIFQRSSPGFDIRPFTSAKLQLAMKINYQGRSPEDVFEVMGDPARLKDWYLLVKQVHIKPPGEDGSSDFDVEFTFFGKVQEEILHWDVPKRYVYKATGPDFPIRDYVAMIEVNQLSEDHGEMRWLAWWDVIEGEHFQRILPAMLPAINEASLERLASLIGGVSHSAESFM